MVAKEIKLNRKGDLHVNASAAYWKHSVYIYAYVNGDYKCAQNSADTIRSFNDYAALGFSNRRYFVPMYFYE